MKTTIATAIVATFVGAYTDRWPLAAIVWVFSMTVYAIFSLNHRSCNLDASSTTRTPRWEIFSLANSIVVVAFTVSVGYLLNFWIDHFRAHSTVFFFAQGNFVLAAAVALACVFYFFAFFGVVFVQSDVAAVGGFEQQSEPKIREEASQDEATVAEELYDYDIIVVGAGTAGTTFATTMARQGRKVLLLERKYDTPPSIVGELLQPGGVRVLERLGMAEAAKGAATDSVPITGYAVLSPSGRPAQSNNTLSIRQGPKCSSDLLLPYPTRDPQQLSEWFGCVDIPEQVDDMGATTDTPKQGALDTDKRPTGRGFHNHLFVKGLRVLAQKEPNLTMMEASVRQVLSLEQVAIKRNIKLPGSIQNECSNGTMKSSLADGTSVVGGVVYKLLSTEEMHTVTAPLVVISDGGNSIFRKLLHTVPKPTGVSFFAGLVLHHKAGESPVPYKNRGHVILADPSPTLLYQISPTETRILVDIPEPLPNVEDGSLIRYMREHIHPQLPPEASDAFLHALDTQEPYIMPNRYMGATKPTLSRALLLGDSWNIRHPLTGGGMTVALKDAECLSNYLRNTDLRSLKALERDVAAYTEARCSHASTINVLANALYLVFSAPPHSMTSKHQHIGFDYETRSRLREACKRYMAMGSCWAMGPIGLLSGLTPSPSVLALHFFAVAFFATWHAIFPMPTLTRLRQAYDLLHVACMIIMPLLYCERATALVTLPLRVLINLIFPFNHVAVAKMTLQ